MGDYPALNHSGSSIENIVFMENLSSGEHFLREGEEPRRVLADINLVIKRGQSWGINGRSLFEIKLLLEIMANIRPYDGGRCVLTERGMMRHKRIILQHVFYIGNADMLYNNMNVLEYLMFATAGFRTSWVEHQERLFEFIIEAGLGHISLTPIEMLTKAEKAVITLLAAAYSDCLMIVLNLPDYEFDGVLTAAVAKISAFIRERGKTLVLSTRNNLLIEKACTHTAFVADGEIIYRGTVDDLRFNFDHIVLMIRDKKIDIMLTKLAALLPEYWLFIKGGRLMISSQGREEQEPHYLYQKIIEAGFAPESIETNLKTVENAYEEIGRQHDLQKQLFQERASSGLY